MELGSVQGRPEGPLLDVALQEGGQGLARQLSFCIERVPFYRQRREAYARALQEKDQAAAFNALPILFKQQVRGVPPFELLPEQRRGGEFEYPVHRGTGGTTGAPVSVLYERADWELAVEMHRARFQRAFGHIASQVAFNNYHQGHISGPVFSESISRSGGICINRSFKANDAQALKELAWHRCNVIIAPPDATHKGGTLSTLLELDSIARTPYFTAGALKGVVLSSTSLKPGMLEELRRLGVVVVNCYGSTEIMPVAFSCPRDEMRFHLVGEPFAAHVVDRSGRLVGPGQRGMVVLSRFARHEDGAWTPSASTSLMKFFSGDEAAWHTDPCPCGHKGASLTDIRRVADIEEKELNGCQAW